MYYILSWWEPAPLHVYLRTLFFFCSLTECVVSGRHPLLVVLLHGTLEGRTLTDFARVISSEVSLSVPRSGFCLLWILLTNGPVVVSGVECAATKRVYTSRHGGFRSRWR